MYRLLLRLGGSSWLCRQLASVWPRWWLVVLLGFGVACADRGCASDPNADVPKPPVVEKAPTPADASTSWRFIASKAELERPCVEVDGFSVRQLFGGPDTEPQSLPAPLRRFCIYETNERSIGVDEVPQALRTAGVSAVEPDLAAVYGSAPLAELLGPGASQALDRQVGRLPKLPEAITQPVTVAILDTMATQSAPNVLQFKSGLEGHGELLARIMGRVLCDDAEQCVAGLRSELAMPYRSSSTGQVEEDRNQGGTYGTVAGLAEALNALAKVHPGSEPLVINLSLGWSPVYGGAQSDARSWPLSVQAVHDALVYARCRGALIFAAAGNQTGGSLHRDGLLLPALWSREAAPGASECAEFGVETDTGTSDGLAPALLYAIGGIDGRGAEIANAREQSQPPLVAHGDQATTRMAKGYTQALTGTSVSTAVVSAIAALVWAHNPTFRTDDVVNALYAFGEDVGAVSATCYGPGCSNRPVRRANACLALTQACAQSSSACAGQVPRCESWKRSAPAAPSGLLADFGAATIPSPVFPASPKSDPVCGPLELYPSVGAHLCPDRQFYSPAAKPWTHPQPGSSPCPNCRAASTLNVIVLESTWVLETSSVLSLQVNGPTSTQTYDLSGVQWPPGSQEGTLMMQPGVLSNAESVTLSMGNGGSNTIVPIPIVE